LIGIATDQAGAVDIAEVGIEAVAAGTTTFQWVGKIVGATPLSNGIAMSAWGATDQRRRIAEAIPECTITTTISSPRIRLAARKSAQAFVRAFWIVGLGRISAITRSVVFIHAMLLQHIGPSRRVGFRATIAMRHFMIGMSRQAGSGSA
jgi:hypothetical protein